MSTRWTEISCALFSVAASVSLLAADSDAQPVGPNHSTFAGTSHGEIAASCTAVAGWLARNVSNQHPDYPSIIRLAEGWSRVLDSEVADLASNSELAQSITVWLRFLDETRTQEHSLFTVYSRTLETCAHTELAEGVGALEYSPSGLIEIRYTDIERTASECVAIYRHSFQGAHPGSMPAEAAGDLEWWLQVADSQGVSEEDIDNVRGLLPNLFTQISLDGAISLCEGKRRLEEYRTSQGYTDG